MAKRRGHGEGSISQRANGSWTARYRVELPDGTRVRRTITGASRKEVAERLAEALAHRNRGTVFDETTTLGEWLGRWLRDSVEGSFTHGTLRQYRTHANHLKRALGGTKLAKLSPAAIQGFYSERLQAGAKPASVRLTHAVLHRSLESAVRFGLIPTNPARRVDPPKPKPPDIHPLSPEQARTFLDAAKGEKHETLFVVALTTGMRVGELLGLKWEDVDLEAGTLHVRHQLQRYPGTGPVFVPPKDGSARTIALSRMAVESLRRHRREQAAQRLGALYWDAQWGLVFASEVGTPLEPQHIATRHFRPLLRQAGLPDLRFHDLRHSCATLLLARGTHPTYVQRLLGHASVKMTLDRYSHWMPSMGRVAANEMDAALG